MAKLVHTFEKHDKDVNCCSFSSNSKYLASAAGDKTVRVWDISNGDEIECSPLTGHTYSVTACCFSPFGSLLATGSQDYTIILWNMPAGEQSNTLHGHKGIIRCITFSLSSQYIASASSDETVCIWDLNSFSLIRKLTGPEVSLMTCNFTPDDLYVVGGSVYGDVRIWEFSSGKYETMVEAHDAGVSGVGITGCDFSPTFGAADSSSAPAVGGESARFLLATCGGDNLVKLWLVRTASAYSTRCNFEPHSTLEGHSGHVWDCKFSSNGKILVSCSADKTVIIWNPLSGETISKLNAHTRYIITVAISPDGLYFATGSNDKTVKVWEFDETQVLASNTCNDISNSLEDTTARKKLIREWTIDDVVEWLKELSLTQYCEVFRENVIDGVELMQITDQMLHTGLGITALGHRNKIIRELAALKKVEIEGNIPDEFLCPITRELMIDPVVAADGYTYERSSITTWLGSGKDTSPMTNTKLPHINLIPNRPLKSAIVRFFGPDPLNFIV